MVGGVLFQFVITLVVTGGVNSFESLTVSLVMAMKNKCLSIND